MKAKIQKQAINMLEALGNEHNEGGFNEFPQFCEETLTDLIKTMTGKQLEWLIGEIEKTSCSGINRKSY